MARHFRGVIIRKYGLICGPHPEYCDCCRRVRLDVFKRLERRLKRTVLKRETMKLIQFESMEIDNG